MTSVPYASTTSPERNMRTLRPSSSVLVPARSPLLVAELKSRGVDIWAVSSTNDWVIEEGVRRFGIPPARVLSARVKVRDGVVTDTILDVPTDEGKVASLARVGVTAPDAVFGNSVHDAAMLAIARRAYPVNPTAALLERSTQEGWAVYYPASVRPA